MRIVRLLLTGSSRIPRGRVIRSAGMTAVHGGAVVRTAWRLRLLVLLVFPVMRRPVIVPVDNARAEKQRHAHGRHRGLHNRQ